MAAGTTSVDAKAVRVDSIGRPVGLGIVALAAQAVTHSPARTSAATRRLPVDWLSFIVRSPFAVVFRASGGTTPLVASVWVLSLMRERGLNRLRLLLALGRGQTIGCIRSR